MSPVAIEAMHIANETFRLGYERRVRIGVCPKLAAKLTMRFAVLPALKAFCERSK